MDKEAILQETYNSAFKDELEKLSGVKSWVAAGSAAGGLLGGGIGGVGGAMSAKKGKKLKAALIGGSIGAVTGGVAGGYTNRYLGKNMPTILRTREANRLNSVRNIGKKQVSDLAEKNYKEGIKYLDDTGLNGYVDMNEVWKNINKGVPHKGRSTNEILKTFRIYPPKNTREYPSVQEIKNNLVYGSSKDRINNIISMKNKSNLKQGEDYMKNTIDDMARKNPKFGEISQEGRDKIEAAIRKARELKK